MTNKNKTVLHILNHSLFNFILAASNISLIVVIARALRGHFVGWYLSVVLLAFFLVSLFFLYMKENAKTMKTWYIFFAFFVLYVMAFWKIIIRFWESTPEELQTSVVGKSWGLVDSVIAGFIIAFVILIVNVFLTPYMENIRDKYFPKLKTNKNTNNKT